MNWWSRLSTAIKGGKEPRDTDPGFIYLKLPLVGHHHRREREAMAERLQLQLEACQAGQLIGEGDSLGPVDANGERPVAWHRMDIETPSTLRTRELLRALVMEMGYDDGCEIHFSKGRLRRVDLRKKGQWLLDQTVDF
jgi:hypothetical protein